MAVALPNGPIFQQASPLPAMPVLYYPTSPVLQTGSPLFLPRAEILKLTKKDVRERTRSVRKNQYMNLNTFLPTGGKGPEAISPAPRSPENLLPIYHAHGASPATYILLMMKQQWQLPIDPGVATKIGPHYYIMHPCPDVIYDAVPLNKVDPTILYPAAVTIQRLFLFRYLLGMNMNPLNIYCRASPGGSADRSLPVVTGIFSGTESHPFGLRPNSNSCVPDFIERKSMQFTTWTLKNWFPQSPSLVLRAWWRIDNTNEEEKLQRLYHWVRELSMPYPGYQLLADLVYRRARQLLNYL